MFYAQTDKSYFQVLAFWKYNFHNLENYWGVKQDENTWSIRSSQLLRYFLLFFTLPSSGFKSQRKILQILFLGERRSVLEADLCPVYDISLLNKRKLIQKVWYLFSQKRFLSTEYWSPETRIKSLIDLEESKNKK